MFLAEAQRFKEASKNKISILIAEPSIGVINYQAHEACCDLIASLVRYEFESNYKFFKACLGRLLVAYSREKFSEYAVKVGFDYIMFIDDDHIWPSDLFQRLEKHIKDYDIVAPLCVQRLPPYYPVIYKSEFTQNIQGTVWNNKKYVELKEIKKGDVITDADAIGFGAAIVKVDLLRRMKQPWFFTTSPVGEDIYFCMQAKGAGAKILVDTNVEAPHLKERETAHWKSYEQFKTLPDNAKHKSGAEEGCAGVIRK